MATKTLGVAMLLMLLSAAMCANAPTLDPKDVTESATLAQLRQLCREAGFKPEDIKDDDGDPGLRMKMGDYQVALILYGKGGKFEGVSCQANFEVDKLPSLTKLNEWNATHRFTRAYMAAAQSRVTLDADIDFSGGVTWMTLANFLKTFEASVDGYAKHLGFK